MSEFLLLGARPPAPGEASLGGIARDVMALAAWHGWLRRWGLLRSFGLPPDPAGELRACLVIRASGQPAAERLAAGWGQVSGYRVMLVPLSCKDAGREGRGERGDRSGAGRCVPRGVAAPGRGGAADHR